VGDDWPGWTDCGGMIALCGWRMAGELAWVEGGGMTGQEEQRVMGWLPLAVGGGGVDE
jgi:hypothetical protein